MSAFKNGTLLCCLAYAGPAAAVGGGRSDDHMVTIFIVQIALMLLVGRSLGELMQRIGQPSVIGQLIAGVLLGPSVLGTLWPAAHQLIFPDTPEQKKMLEAISQLGILMLLLLTGMETDLSLVKERRRTAFCTSLSGIALPFAAGFALGQFLPASMLRDPAQRLLTSLFLATALSISSVKIVAVVLMEVDFFRRNIGQIIIATAILDDTIAWILIAIIGGLAVYGNVDIGSILLVVVGALVFFWVSLTVGRRIVAYLIRWTNDHLVIEMPVITTILIMMLGMALITDYIGLHTVLGAFVAGIVIGQSPILTTHIDEQLRGLIVAMFMPVFFAMAGLSIDISVIGNPALMGFTAGVILIASLGKMLGCYLGGRIGGLTGREALALGFGMNARGSTEVLVATVGLSMGILNHDLYTLIVFMAVFTTMLMPPLLKWALARIPPSEEEQARLEHEEMEAKEFVPNLERLLVTVDASESGKLAARLAGLLAGGCRITTTVLEISKDNDDEKRKGDDSPMADIVKTSMEFAIRNLPVEAHEGKETMELPSLTAQTCAEEISEAVLQETKKGYDIVFLGVGRAFGDAEVPPGHFSLAIEKIVDSYENATAIALKRPGRILKQAPHALNILVPTTGADYSRRAAEVAIALAKASGGQVTALYVIPPAVQGNLPRLVRTMNYRFQRVAETGRALVDNIQALGTRYGVTVVPEMVEGLAVENAVLSQVMRNQHDLVVLGAKARPGEGLFFGHKTAAILEQMPGSCLIVSS